jgi:hypothetical protein
VVSRSRSIEPMSAVDSPVIWAEVFHRSGRSVIRASRRLSSAGRISTDGAAAFDGEVCAASDDIAPDKVRRSRTDFVARMLDVFIGSRWCALLGCRSAGMNAGRDPGGTTVTMMIVWMGWVGCAG